MNRAMVPPGLVEAVRTLLGRFCAEFLRALDTQ